MKSTPAFWAQCQILILRASSICRVISSNISATSAEFSPPSVEIKLWTGEELELLGTDTDAEIGRVLRRSASSVRQARLNRGIPAYRVAIGSPERRERAGLIRVNDSTRDLISELEPLLLLRYQAAGLPIDRLDPWQIVEIALRELRSGMKNGATK